MSEVKAWLKNDDDTKWIWDDQMIVFEAVDATPEQVRWVCALPQIMAALREWTEANAAILESWECGTVPQAAERYDAAHTALLALYERLK